MPTGERRFKRRNKYGAVKCTAVDGTVCDSRVEALYYNQLINNQNFDFVSYHESFEIVPRFSLKGTHYSHRVYTPDFSFYNFFGALEYVVDVKGGTATMTTSARLRIIMFMQHYKVPVMIARYDARTGLFVEEQA